MTGRCGWRSCLQILGLVLSVLGSTVHPISAAVGTGRLASLLPRNRALVVEIPQGDDLLTVGGHLADGAILLRCGLRADLADFQVGETVTVTWSRSEDGHRILALRLAGSCRDSGPGPELPIEAPCLQEFGTLIGINGSHVVAERETLLDIARMHDLGINELQALYPGLDPWLPPVGMKLLIPARRILPSAPLSGIVINIPEMRLYRYAGKKRNLLVETHPVGIGGSDFPTPVGKFVIGDKRQHPVWHIPPSLQAKYGVRFIMPGPDNPLGDYWMGLAGTMYGIHGTDMPWSVGRLVTHGCIRLYPEDIARLYRAVERGDRVNLVYQTVKIAATGGSVFIEVEEDVYGSGGRALQAEAERCLRLAGVEEEWVDRERLQRALSDRSGQVTDITDRYRVNPCQK